MTPQSDPVERSELKNREFHICAEKNKISIFNFLLSAFFRLAKLMLLSGASLCSILTHNTKIQIMDTNISSKRAKPNSLTKKKVSNPAN